MPFPVEAGYIVCVCGYWCRKSKIKWLKHLRSDHEDLFKEIINKKKCDAEAQQILEEQIELLSDDEVPLHTVLSLKRSTFCLDDEGP